MRPPRRHCTGVMEPILDRRLVADHRDQLMQFLNDNGLDGESILSISRRAEPVVCRPEEPIFRQGQDQRHVFFLVDGMVGVHILADGIARELGERRAVSVLGEISFFNGTAASANVVVKGGRDAVLFRVDYDTLDDIIANYPRVRDCLNRIGDLRLITQDNGFAAYRHFMDMIGWKHKRFGYDHQMLPIVERALRHELLPRLGPEDSLLEVGDGPGIICELLLERRPECVDCLHIQANDLEQAILRPFSPLSSDLSRARFQQHTFDILVALQVFNIVPQKTLGEQFEIARRLVRPGGYLFLVKSRLVNVSYAPGSSETELFFHHLEAIVDRYWPGVRGDGPLIETTFVDADMDPLMNWNTALCARAERGELPAHPDMSLEERELIEHLLHQASQNLFNPDELYFRWLAVKALLSGFTLEAAHHRPDVGFYYQVLYRV